MNDIPQKIDERKSRLIKYISISLSIIILMIFAAFVINIFLNRNNPIDYSHLLYDESKDIVYQLHISSIKENDKLPIININNRVVEEINQEIIDSYYDYLAKYNDGFTYEYNVSKNILSLLIKSYQRYGDSNHYDIVYKTYNLDLTTFKLLNEKELLKSLISKKKKLNYFIAYKFSNYYNDLLAKKYFTERECDFTCFLESKQVDDFLADNNYYINNNHLEVYKYFNIFTEYNEQEYFTEDSFHFVIK